METSKAERKSSSANNAGEREKWDNKIEFVLSTTSFAVGLGNIWRFPYLCYKNGGGAFLIPYIVSLILGGVPMFFLEIAIGQYTSQGGMTVWNEMAPMFTGIGYATTIICCLLNLYYIVILAWALHFFIASFTTELPWATCGNSWSTPNCFQPSAMVNTSLNGSRYVDLKDSAVEYWENRVLGISSGIGEVGSIQWELAGTLLLAWIVVYFCIWKGVKTSGKVVYFTATFPYLMLTILFVRGITLPGAWEGIKYYLTPDFSMIFQGQVWMDAGTQVMYSYAAGLGCMIALGSYNKYNNNFMRDCTFITICNSGTSIYAGFVVFSVLGFMAVEQGMSVAEVAESGPGLVFIAYPKALAQLPWAPLWSVLFFFMILLVGLGSEFIQVEGFVTAVVDVFPGLLRGGHGRKVFVAVVALVLYLLGLTMVTNGGMYVFQLFDYYACTGTTIFWVTFCECIAVAWVYGIGKFTHNIKEMVGYWPSIWLPIAWTYLTPIFTMTLLLYSILKYEPLKYNKSYEYPIGAQMLGGLMALSSMLMIPGTFIYKYTKQSIQNAREKAEQDSREENLMQNGKTPIAVNGFSNHNNSSV